jgi:hypothetical protein
MRQGIVRKDLRGSILEGRAVYSQIRVYRYRVQRLIAHHRYVRAGFA